MLTVRQQWPATKVVINLTTNNSLHYFGSNTREWNWSVVWYSTGNTFLKYWCDYGIMPLWLYHYALSDLRFCSFLWFSCFFFLFCFTTNILQYFIVLFSNSAFQGCNCLLINQSISQSINQSIIYLTPTTRAHSHKHTYIYTQKTTYNHFVRRLLLDASCSNF